jgi:hypothetical protein
MSEDKKKPREWTQVIQPMGNKGSYTIENVHVIEKSEYDALRALLSQAKEALLLCAPSIDKRSSTYKELESVLNKIRAALGEGTLDQADVQSVDREAGVK